VSTENGAAKYRTKAYSGVVIPGVEIYPVDRSMSAAVATPGGTWVRLPTTGSHVRNALLVTSLMTLLLMLTTMLLLMVPITPTLWTAGSVHCAAAVDNKNHRRQSTSVNVTTDISSSVGHGHQRFIVNNVQLCDAVVDDDDVTSYPVYVVLVHSRPGQRGRMQRDAIRVTWGSTLHRRVAVPDTRLAFMLGRDRDCTGSGAQCFESLRRESRLYGDVIVADFDDAYRSLSLKSLSGLAWARRHCPTARYIVKADDDVYLRPDLLPRVYQLTSSDHVIVGSLNVNSSVQRRGLWRVDERAFPASVFPPYCSGNVYAMTSSVADRLLKAAAARGVGDQPPFPLEDVYITALLATSAGARCVRHDAFPRWDVGPSRLNVERLRNGSLLAVHNVHYTQMYGLL